MTSPEDGSQSLKSDTRVQMTCRFQHKSRGVRPRACHTPEAAAPLDAAQGPNTSEPLRICRVRTIPGLTGRRDWLPTPVNHTASRSKRGRRMLKDKDLKEIQALINMGKQRGYVTYSGDEQVPPHAPHLGRPARRPHDHVQRAGHRSRQQGSARSGKPKSARVRSTRSVAVEDTSANAQQRSRSGCTFARWARCRCCRVKARSRSPSASKKGESIVWSSATCSRPPTSLVHHGPGPRRVRRRARCLKRAIRGGKKSPAHHHQRRHVASRPSASRPCVELLTTRSATRPAQGQRSSAPSRKKRSAEEAEESLAAQD